MQQYTTKLNFKFNFNSRKITRPIEFQNDDRKQNARKNTTTMKITHTHLSIQYNCSIWPSLDITSVGKKFIEKSNKQFFWNFIKWIIFNFWLWFSEHFNFHIQSWLFTKSKKTTKITSIIASLFLFTSLRKIMENNWWIQLEIWYLLFVINKTVSFLCNFCICYYAFK